MARETRVQSQVASYQRLLKWYLIPPCLTISIIRYVSRVKWSNSAPSPTPRCSSYWKGSLLVALDFGRQLFFLLISAKYRFAMTSQSQKMKRKSDRSYRSRQYFWNIKEKIPFLYCNTLAQKELLIFKQLHFRFLVIESKGWNRVWFLCLMSYQPLWVILCQCHSPRRTVVVLYNP